MKYIFIHGLGQTASSWHKTLSYLSAYTPVSSIIELSSLYSNKRVSYTDLYRRFEKYCNGVSEPINLCGLSLGAVLALNYAIEHPEKVKALILIAPQYKIPRLLLGFQNMIFRFIPQTYFQKMGFNKDDFLYLANSMMNLDFSNTVKNISCSTLIICGKQDLVNMVAAKKLNRSIPGSKLHLIKDAGHEVNTDAPKELATILNLFFSNL